MCQTKKVIDPVFKHYCTDCHSLLVKSKSKIIRHNNTNKHIKNEQLRKDFKEDEFVKEIDDYIYNITYAKY